MSSRIKYETFSHILFLQYTISHIKKKKINVDPNDSAE